MDYLIVGSRFVNESFLIGCVIMRITELTFTIPRDDFLPLDLLRNPMTSKPHPLSLCFPTPKGSGFTAIFGNHVHDLLNGIR